MVAPIHARLPIRGGRRVAKTSEKMNRIGPFHVDTRTIGILCRAFVVTVACMVALNEARAEVRVSGVKNAVTVHAKDASIVDVIAAVNAALHVEVSMASAGAIPVTGTYSGSLRRVFARMLAGHDFILESSGDKMTITLASQTGHRPRASHGPAAARANVAAEEAPNRSGVQGWDGGFRPKSPTIRRAN
jgi:hypothetical protein